MIEANLEQSCRIADNVSKLEDVGSELFLHVTQEKHRILGGKSADFCHCDCKVTTKKCRLEETVALSAQEQDFNMGMAFISIAMSFFQHKLGFLY